MLYRSPLLAFLSSTRHYQIHRKDFVKRPQKNYYFFPIKFQTTSSSSPQRYQIPIMNSSGLDNKLPIYDCIKDAQHSILQSINYESKLRTGTAQKVTTPCGELRCQHDSLLSTLSTAQIVTFAPFTITMNDQKSSSSSKKKKKKKNSSSQNKEEEKATSHKKQYHYAIVLSDSIFFPEGGGQPNDIGELIVHYNNTPYPGISNSSASDITDRIHFQVNDVQNVQGTCVLSCTTITHDDSFDKVTSILSSASKYQQEDNEHPQFQIIQNVNWEKRWEYMTSHSAQHLISATALNEFGINTQSFSLRPDNLISYIDFIWDAIGTGDGDDDNNKNFKLDDHESLNDDDSIKSNEDFKSIFSQIENKVNERIQSNLSMSPTWIDPNDKESYKDKEGLRSRLLPKGLTGKIRLMQIDDGVDLNTCCGTHVKHLSQLQMIKFFRIEKFKFNIVRVYFASGSRLMKILQGYYDQSVSVTNMLCCTEQQTVDRVNNLLEDKRVKEKEVKDLKEKLSKVHVKEVVTELKNNDNVAIVDLGFGIDLGYMTMISNQLADLVPMEEVIILLVGSIDDSSPSSIEEGTFLLLGQKGLVDNIGKDVASLLCGRGGGKNGKYQGKGSKVRSALEEVKALLTMKKNEALSN